VPECSIELGALAALANPLRGAVRPGTEPGLEATAYFGLAKGATAAGAHAMIVEIDSATMKLRILKYVVVHDCGIVINPLLVAGQIQGGIAQGIGNAFYERLAFDEQGQVINGTLADYLLPTAPEVPQIEILEVPLDPGHLWELAGGAG
jgi:aerobic carbon-monoxide dehydrogenase large subunit